MTTHPMRSSRRVAAAAGGAFASIYIFYTSAPSTGLRVGIVMLIVVVVQPFVPLLSWYVSTRRRMVTAALAAMGAGSLACGRSGSVLGAVATEEEQPLNLSIEVCLPDGEQVLLDGTCRAVFGDVDVDSGVVKLLDDGDVIGVLEAESS
ncbi:hypothetical protein [uncultured Brevibacterium sp.]|uniref:hypothetical protein n=1 Tax=uncultured Brevibacterium sp. TaxID=189678 RepID=UPI0025FDD1C9|nr:hypothetical protein [uncultured Brevibacterium sp.]